ncbi:MAG: SGNH/GDSL hydrolase family protein [bacterium]
MKRKKIFIFFCLILAGCFLAAEMAVRQISYTDIDRNCYFQGVRIKPFRLPLTSTGKLLDRYRSSSSSYMIYDADLGWDCRPGGKSRNGLYKYNSLGIRSAPREYPLTSDKKKFRIMLFGDSFTHCDDVAFEKSWGYYLEKNLQTAGIPAEVINLGVGGYGMDQALLRWRKLGRRFSADLVIFGFMPDNVKRNVNMFRKMIYPPTGIPFSKPRFIEEGDSLKPVNAPTVPLGKLMETLRNFNDWKFAPYEFFFHPGDFQKHFWQKSRFISLTGRVLEYLTQGKFSSKGRADVYFSLKSEPARISLKIIRKFKQEVEAAGAHFMIVHLISDEFLGYLLKGEKLVYREMLKELDKHYQVIHPESDLLKAARNSSSASLFRGHYSPKGNRVVADSVARYILESRKKIVLQSSPQK